MKNGAVKLMRSALLTALVCTVLTAGAFAADGLGAFSENTREYRTGLFSDVAAGAWYESAVKTVVQKGIMDGTGDGFLPDKPMTWAEAATITARLHAAYHGAKIPETGGSYWYQKYLDYDAANNLLPLSFPGAWESGAQEIAREDLCLLMRGVLSDADLPVVNDSAVPDLSAARNSARDAVQAMYAAGIFTGKDGGNFRPAASATRAEIATVVTRLICPAQRVGADSRATRAMAEQYGNFLTNGCTVRLSGRNYYLVQTAQYDSASGKAAAVSEIVSRTDSGAVATVYRTENSLSLLSAGDDGKLYFVETSGNGVNLTDTLRRIAVSGGTIESLYSAYGIKAYSLYNGKLYLLEQIKDGTGSDKWSYRIGVLTGRSLRHLTPTMNFGEALYADSSLYCFGGKLYYLCGDSSYEAEGERYYNYSLYEIDLQTEMRAKLIDGAGYNNLYLGEIAYVGATAWFLGATEQENARVVKRANLRLPQLVETVASVPAEACRNYVKMFANGTSVYYNASGAKRLWQISAAGDFSERIRFDTQMEEGCPAVTPQGILAPNSDAVVLPDKSTVSYLGFLGKPYLIKGKSTLAAASGDKLFVAPQWRSDDWTGGLVREFRTADGSYVAELRIVNGTAREVKLDAIAFELTIGNVTLCPRLSAAPLSPATSQTYTLVVPAQALGAAASATEAKLDWWYYVLN